MQKLTILNTREIKKIREQCVKQFNNFLKEDYAYLLNEKERLFIVNKDISKINLKNLIIDKYGFYFAEVKENQVRLSKEGAQLLIQQADKPLKNVVKLTNSELKDYFKGIDLDKNLGEESKLILLQHDNDTIGCARYKDNKILNFLPKMNRGEVII